MSLLAANLLSNNRMQPDFGELALPSAADAGRYVADNQRRPYGMVNIECLYFYSPR